MKTYEELLAENEKLNEDNEILKLKHCKLKEENDSLRFQNSELSEKDHSEKMWIGILSSLATIVITRYITGTYHADEHWWNVVIEVAVTIIGGPLLCLGISWLILQFVPIFHWKPRTQTIVGIAVGLLIAFIYLAIIYKF